MNLKTGTVLVPDAELQSGATGISYYEKGDGPKTIVMAHGMGADSYEFIHQTRYFSNRYRCIAFDQRGHGHSPATPNMGIRRSVLDMLSLTEQLGVKKFILMGHSLGTMVAFDFAARYPEKVDKLIIVSGTPAIRESLGSYIGLKVLPSITKLVEDRHRSIVRYFFGTYIGMFGFLSSPDVVNYFLVNNPLAFTEKYFESCAKYMHSIAEFDVRDRLQRITAPTLVVHGAFDPAIYAFTSLTPVLKVHSAKWHIFPYCGHSPNIEAPGLFNAVVEKFLESKFSNSRPW